jgi:trimeric autotransporter adhesin
MKKLFLFLFFFVSVKNLIAQNVGIGTITPAASAQLDITSTTKGLLIPRMTKTQKNAILSPVAGLLVYQTGPDSSGFHYYTGTAWLWLEPVATNAWKTTGNTGTDTAVNFMGTTDNMPLRFKQNNQWLGQWDFNRNNYFIGQNTGRKVTSGDNLIGIGDSVFQNTTTAGANIGIGYHSLRENTSGNLNIGIGINTLRSTSTGYRNTAVGNNAAQTIIAGYDNTAIGYGSMLSTVTTITGNTALGSQTMWDMQGNNNIAVGFQSLFSTTTGDLSIAIGYQALYNGTSGDRNIAIGERAMYNGNPSGANNVALGAVALANLTSGSSNIGIGISAAPSLTTGSSNIAVGASALQNSVTGDHNIAIGQFALRYRDGFGNVAIGNSAGGSGAPAITETANFNTLIGHVAGGSLLGDGNVFIGYNAGSTETNTNNKLIIHNTNSTSPLLSGNFLSRNFLTMGYFQVADSNVLFNATGNIPVTPTNPPTTGEGRRTMWYTDKAAFRTGYVASANWDKDSIGNYSFAAGTDVKAKGSSSIAMGNNSQALTSESFAIGNNAVAVGLGARALGLNALANGDQSTAIGFNTTASGTYAVALNSNTTAAAIAAVATGGFTTSTGDYSSAHGRFTKSKSYAGVVIGTFNDSTNAANPSGINGANRLFQIGNGIADNLRNNAFTVLHSGAIGFNTASPVTLIDANGDLALRQNEVTVANGVNNDVSTGPYSFVKVTGPSAAFSISGFSGGVDGKILTVLNLTTQNMTIVNQTGSASVLTNRINTLSGADIVTTGNGSVTMQYSIADNRWMVIAVRD